MLTETEIDTLVRYCDLACRQGGLNVAHEAIPIAQKLLAMKAKAAAPASTATEA